MFCIALGGGALYLPVVGLKEIAAEFGDRRAVPSMAYMLGFFAMGMGGVFMGWLADRTSPRVPLLIAGVSIFAGGWLAAQRRRARALCSATRSRWASSAMPPPSRPAHEQHPGLVRPPAQHRRLPHLGRARRSRASCGRRSIAGCCRDVGWRQTAGDLRRRGRRRCCSCAPSMCGPRRSCAAPASARRRTCRSCRMPSPAIMVLLSAAGFCCCAAMAMPFVHMVAFCGDLGFAAGARHRGDLADPADSRGLDLRHGPARPTISGRSGQPALRR